MQGEDAGGLGGAGGKTFRGQEAMLERFPNVGMQRAPFGGVLRLVQQVGQFGIVGPRRLRDQLQERALDVHLQLRVLVEPALEHRHIDVAGIVDECILGGRHRHDQRDEQYSYPAFHRS